MKNFIKLLTVAATLFAVGCQKYNDTPLKNRVGELENRVAALEELCKQMNTNISSLQTIVNALQEKDYITGVFPVTKDGETVGYTITFGKTQPITIYNGKDGKDGNSPTISVKQDSDGIYYWTLNGEWLLDGAGNKVKAEGRDGEDGKDGVTPRLRITDGYWEISYNGESWTRLGKATGEDGADGNTIFTSVTQDDNYVYFTLTDGSVITISKTKQHSDADAIEFADSNVKLICIVNWDTDKDGELSYEEAKAVTTIGNKFECSKIISFEEFQYFTGITSLNNSAFAECYSLAKIILPDGLKNIGEDAFYGCMNLSEISFPASVTTIRDEAFASCSTFTTVTVPETVTSIGNGVFSMCDNLTSFCGPYASDDGRCLIINDSLKAFAPKGITEYSIPEGVKSIAKYTFEECNKLTSITIPFNMRALTF